MNEAPTANEFIEGVIKNAAESPEFKKELISNPKEVFEKRLNYKLPEDFEIAVHEDTPMRLNIILPMQSEELSELELSAVSGGALCWTNCPYQTPY